VAVRLGSDVGVHFVADPVVRLLATFERVADGAPQQQPPVRPLSRFLAVSATAQPICSCANVSPLVYFIDLSLNNNLQKYVLFQWFLY